LEEGRCSYLGRSRQFARIGEKSAEAIVGFGNELSLNGGGLTDKPKG